MRLIHTGMKELVEWHGEENCPPYAILSHTWSENDSEEVTFQELKAAIGPNPGTSIDAIISKPGYEKIRNFCDEAIRRGYDWVWVDTCCINKESSSELSEAINSMYRWYEQSALCIAYLADVQASSINLTDLNSESNSEFRKSRWFTRGWTLQELIAPRTLEFYNESWERIGDRLALAPFIGEICGLPRDLLSSKKKPSEYSIAQRMSWAAKRRTKRIEDRTYCLLGLFEINMPLIYGEADAAFQRLQKKIIKKSNDQTIFAWGFCLPDEMVLSSGSPQLMSILADSPDSFEGCGDIILYLHNSLTIWDYSYQLTKEGIHMAIIYVGDPTSIDKSRLIDILFCTRCRPLEDITDAIMLESSYIPEAFLAIDPPYSLGQTPRTEEIPTVTISPYGTVIIPDGNLGWKYIDCPEESTSTLALVSEFSSELPRVASKDSLLRCRPGLLVDPPV
ncbi:hypothetical protein NUW58_g2549 [Xylaria curta]|uniref:Uncharacterized protein n=1 Tax=Xylaria curta TaxID=42375 RepID=A0ACC1PHE6_9PEZI|nr:hypothetical protein NUW58_g2549 [Xylaria curta]